jgi:hypothetical protein
MWLYALATVASCRLSQLDFERGPGAFCQQDGVCADGLYCELEAQRCTELLVQGASCGRPGQCTTGRCVDGVCCNGPCNATCLACDLPGREGVCTVVSPYEDPHDDCPGTATCGVAADGTTGSGRCQGTPVWGRAFGGDGDQTVTATATTPGGAIVAVGELTGSINFGAGPLASRSGSRDVFVVRLDAEGILERDERDAPVLALRLGGAGDESAAGLGLDASGNTIVALDFEGSIALGASLAGDPAIRTADGRDVLVVKLGPAGELLWHRQLGGPGDQRVRDVAVRADDGAVLAGDFGGSMSFEGDVAVAADASDVWVALLLADGQVAWHRTYPAAGPQEAGGVALDASDDVAIAAHGHDGIDFGLGPLEQNGGADDDVFVAKLAGGDGAVVWSVAFGREGNQHARTVAVAPATGNVWIAGSFEGGMELGQVTHAAQGAADGFFVELGAADAALEASGAVRGPFVQTPLDVVIDASGDALLAGLFQASLEIGGETIDGFGGTDVFVLRLDAMGALEWVVPFGGPLDDAATALALHQGRILVGGAFRAEVDLGSVALESLGGSDALVGLLDP